jgi:hypothetical protein
VEKSSVICTISAGCVLKASVEAAIADGFCDVGRLDGFGIFEAGERTGWVAISAVFFVSKPTEE